MKKIWFLIFIVNMIIVLFSLSSCGWFSDNPMFPRAKVKIVGEVIASSGATNSNLGLVKFTFTPLNKVGVRMTQCKLEYKKVDGFLLSSLATTIPINIDVIPIETPMASMAGIEDASVSYEIDLLPPNVETYLKLNRIPTVVVTVTFHGTDYATHAVSYSTGAFRLNLLEAPLEGLSLTFFCSAGGECPSCGSSAMASVGCVLDTKTLDPAFITKVEFSMNGESAGVDTKPPFLSNTVSMDFSSTVVGVALVYDINGGMIMVTESKKVSDICAVSTPAPTP
ncbi:MAG: hypothetical protein ACUVQZ_05090 [Candidatus Caldatribacteriaceae bacterium]